MLKGGSKPTEGYVVHQRKMMCKQCVNAEIYALRPAESKRYRAEIVDNTKKCKKCLLFYPFDGFYMARNNIDGLSNVCKECDDFDRHNISQIQYYDLLKLQDYRCAICLTHVKDMERRLYVDHDHRCCTTMTRSCGNCVRGLLCISCNSGLGMLKDDAEVLESALRYLTNKDRKPNG